MAATERERFVLGILGRLIVDKPRPDPSSDFQDGWVQGYNHGLKIARGLIQDEVALDEQIAGEAAVPGVRS